MAAIYLVLGAGAVGGFVVWYNRYMAFVRRRKLLDGYYRDRTYPIVLICEDEEDFDREVSIIHNPDTEDDYEDSLYNQVKYEQSMLEEAENPNHVRVYAIYPYSITESIKNNEVILEAHYGESYAEYAKRANEMRNEIIRTAQIELAKANKTEFINRTHAPGYIHRVHEEARKSK